VLVDDKYIRDSVRTPAKDVVEGFPEGVMPDFSDQISNEQMDEIIEFIKKQSTSESKTVPPA
jgi:mono/diheme cytochrome c family protein